MLKRQEPRYTKVVELINLLYSRQQADGYCLPACVQMALAYLGVASSQGDLARTMGMVHNLGIPASNVLRIRSEQIAVVYGTEGTLDEVRHWLEHRIPVIACVQTSQLTYWHGHVAQHVVLVVGMDEQTVHLFDPAQTDAVIAVSIDEFLLAWDEMAFTYAVLSEPE